MATKRKRFRRVIISSQEIEDRIDAVTPIGAGANSYSSFTQEITDIDQSQSVSINGITEILLNNINISKSWYECSPIFNNHFLYVDSTAGLNGLVNSVLPLHTVTAGDYINGNNNYSGVNHTGESLATIITTNLAALLGIPEADCECTYIEDENRLQFSLSNNVGETYTIKVFDGVLRSYADKLVGMSDFNL